MQIEGPLKVSCQPVLGNKYVLMKYRTVLSGYRATQPPAHRPKNNKKKKNPAMVCFNISTLFIQRPLEWLAAMRAEKDPLIHDAEAVRVVMGPAEGHLTRFKKCRGDFGAVEAPDTRTAS